MNKLLFCFCILLTFFYECTIKVINQFLAAKAQKWWWNWPANYYSWIDYRQLYNSFFFCQINNNQVSGVEVSNVIYQDIYGTSATEIAVKINCSPKYPCIGISLEDVMLTYESKQAVASCNHAGGITSGVVQPNNCF